VGLVAQPYEAQAYRIPPAIEPN